MPLIELDDVSKSYQLGGNTVEAVKHVTLSAEGGEFLAFSGPSGSGKSTLFSLIAAMARPSAGRVAIDGVDVTAFDNSQGALLRRRLFGFVFQSFNLMPVLTAFENIELPLLLGTEPAPARARRVRELAERLEISGLLGHRPNEMSGGQKQRVAIARALVTAPRIVIADEPTANLDSKTGRLVLALAKDLCQRDGVTFLFSSHDPAMVVQAHRVIHLSDGMLARTGERAAPAGAQGADPALAH